MSETLKEHCGYLTDATRQQRFQEALAQVVRLGDTVVDVGSGFGILGLLCLKAGASHVWGIDRTEAAEIARETMRRAGLQSRYTCIQDDSRRAILPERVDLIICDHVGNFGFDYGIVEIIGDARRRLLKPGGRIVPERVMPQIAAVQSPALRALADVWTSEQVLEEFHWIRELGVNAKHHYNFVRADVASSEECLGSIDLRTESREHMAFSAVLKVTRDGDLDGLGGWFSCQIVEDVWMTNSPMAPDPIKRCQVFLPFAQPLAVRAGDALAVSVSARPAANLISWTAQVTRTGAIARHSTWKSTILQPQNMTPAAGRKPRLSSRGEARRTLLAHVDGNVSPLELEHLIAREHPKLFPSPEETARFVREELARNAD